ncbi:MAG TPA: DUF3489 domain-containing protein [Novosphingobium sp.]|nr:DUF3489 domain-containing protein [Novosphingobium sp.]
MTTNTTDKPAIKRPRKMAREPRPQDDGVAQGPKAVAEAAATAPKPEPEPAAPKAPTKTDIVLGLLTRAEGATLEQMVEATGWLPHTTRAALTGLKKKGHEVTSTKVDGVRTYRVITAQQGDANAAAEPKITPDV